MNQPQKTPLTELLRAIPPAQRAEWAFQWGESGQPTGHVMCPFGKLAHEAADEIDRLTKLLADASTSDTIKLLEDVMINQGQSLRQIVSIITGEPYSVLLRAGTAVTGVERLQARVTELEAVAISVRDDLRLRAEPDSDGIPVVALGSSKWQALCEVLTPNKSEKTP